MCGKYAAARAFCSGLPKNKKESKACKTIRRRNRLCAGEAQKRLPIGLAAVVRAIRESAATRRSAARSRMRRWPDLSRKRHGGTAYFRLDLLDVECMRGLSVGENPADAASGEQGRDVVRLRAADAAVGRTGDFAASDDVPDRDVMREQKALLFLPCFPAYRSRVRRPARARNGSADVRKKSWLLWI